MCRPFKSLALIALAVVACSAGARGDATDAILSSRPAGEVLPVILDTRIGERGDRTRFVIEISNPFQVHVFTLSRPDRVVIDMPEVLWQLHEAERPLGRGLVKSYRFGRFRAGDSRFVIDLNEPATVGEPLLLPPSSGHGFRLVLDLVPTPESKFAEKAGWPAYLNAAGQGSAAGSMAALSMGARPVAARSERRVVVVDAGHGGIDAGTTGIDGLMEKDLVLDEAMRLRDELQKRKYTVHLTRSSDTYVPLSERVSVARAYDADLFISLHADSNPDANVSGASVYTLSESGSDREAAALARKENQSDVIAGVDLSGESSPVASILIGLAQRDTLNRSGRFAETAVLELSRATDVLAREPHRSAAFVVLKAPDVPAVLIELGYLSNAQDCARARTADWREGVASAIADAVDRQLGAPRPPLAAATRQAAN